MTEIELDRNLGIGSMPRKRPTSSESTREAGPEETLVGFRKYKERMDKEAPQSFLDFILEVEWEMPRELSPKVLRLAKWARSKEDAGTVRMPQLMEHSTKV